MEQIIQSEKVRFLVDITKQSNQIVIDANQLQDTVIKRLMEEVKNDNANQMFAYDRAHNRHNRGR